ncbi:MAG: hypothetical protein J7K68_00610 [Candidatus Diapherotrites archaeon]|nr:hypothetical protein [Candidatus Diapherotrites archaeon]
MPKLRAREIPKKYMSHLDKYRKTGKPFLHELVDKVDRNTLVALGRAARRIDELKIQEYFAGQGLEIDLQRKESIPEPDFSTLKDVFKEVKEKAEGAPVFMISDKEEIPHLQVLDEFKAYEKKPKPELCEELIKSGRWIGGHELGQLLNTAERLKREEEKDLDPEFKEELRRTREIVERYMLHALKYEFSDMDYMNFLSNFLSQVKKLHKYIEKKQ